MNEPVVCCNHNCNQGRDCPLRKAEINNEPVAWMGKDYDGLKTDLYFDVERNKLPYRLYESAIPLYTHPVKEHFEDEPQAEELHEILQSNAELTDEEIMGISGGENLSEQVFFWNKNAVLNFARAILRKAQEK